VEVAESQLRHRTKDKVQGRGVRSPGGGADLSGGWPGALADGAGKAARGGQRNRGLGRHPNRTRDGGEVEPGPSCRWPRDGDEAGASLHARQGALGRGVTAGPTLHFFRESAKAPHRRTRRGHCNSPLESALRRTRRCHPTSPHPGNAFRDVGEGTGRRAMLQEVGHGGC
jgi:hypothetical protein